MNRPTLYHQYNDVQKCIAEKIWTNYANKMQWRYDGMDTLLDVGTATGGVLMEIVKPIMPKTFRRIVGTDIDANAIAFAKNYYKSPKKCDFHVMDIGMEQELPADLKGQFDHVTSFNCLQWVANQEQAFKNIYQLLKPEGGDCLLSFQPYMPIFDIWEALKDSSTWSPYIGHIDYFTGPLQRIEEDELRSLVESTGFYNVQIEYSYEVHDYQNTQEFTDHMAASCMFLKHIPASMHPKIMVDFLEVARRLGCRASSPCGTRDKYSLNFTNAVVYAKKICLRR